MTTHAPDPTAVREPTGASKSPPAGRRTLAVLQVVTVLHALAMLAQPVLAGQYLDGDVGGISAHGANAFTVAGLDVVQLAAAVAFGWAGRGRWWPVWASLAIAVGVEVQVGFGYASLLIVHVPLGVSLIVAQILTTVWLFRAETATARPARARRPGARRPGARRPGVRRPRAGGSDGQEPS